MTRRVSQAQTARGLLWVENLGVARFSIEKAAERRLDGHRASEGNPRAGRADARVPRSMPSSAVPVLAFLGTEGTGSFIASRLCGRKGSGAVRGCAVESKIDWRKQSAPPPCGRDFEGVAPERHGDARVRASRRRRMRGAAASVVGKRSARHRRPGRAVSGGLERRASRRWRSSLRAYLRKKQLSRAINFLPSLNGATDERAPGRSRPSRLGRARAARGGETPRARVRAQGRFVSRAESRSRGDAYRLALQTDTVDYSPLRNERMLRSGSAPGETLDDARSTARITRRRRSCRRAVSRPRGRWNRPVVPLYRARASRATEDDARRSRGLFIT